MMRLRLMSNNIWGCDNNQKAWQELGEDCSVEARMPQFAKVYAELRPDVIGLQEATYKAVDFLSMALREAGLTYAVHWTRYTSVFYRPDVFEVVDSYYLPYPEEMEGYEGSFNDLRSKSLNLVVLRAKENGRCLVFGNTHLWWKKESERFPGDHWYQPGSEAARVYQMGLASEALARYAAAYDAPTVFLGDMNCQYPTAPIRRALELGFVHAHDVAVEYASEEHGYHYCFGDGHKPYVPEPFENAIDHILVRGADAGFVRRFDRFTPDWYEPLSDHYPVYVDVEF